MNAHDELVERIAAAVGIAPFYTDAFGRRREADPDIRRTVLAALGLDVDDEEAARDSLERVERLRSGPLPPFLLAAADTPVPVRLALDDAAAWQWRLRPDGAAADDPPHRSGSGTGTELTLAPLPAGYFRLAVATDHERAETLLIVSPATCWRPAELEEGRRLWGVTAQVYALRSRRNMGFGDLTDVAEAAGRAATLGASFVGLSPLHALFPSDRGKYSPYSPSSRLFLDPLYIDPAAIPGYAAVAAEMGDALEQARAALHAQGLIDHAAAWSLKSTVLERLWAQYRSGPEDAEFTAFRNAGGAPLRRHALFDALSAHFEAEGRHWLGEWPPAFRDPNTPEVARFARDHEERLAYRAWLQWHADRQLAAAHARARAGGMSIGLYRDLAVGPDGAGSEVWADPADFAPILGVGAPPDPLGPLGQQWGLPPFNPMTLATNGFAAFRALVVANMRHAGALRVDHAFQLRRLFVIPASASAEHGVYLDFPFEALLAILRIESHRARCLVIAEDLGTAPDGFSDAIMASGLFSYRLLPFERLHDGGFKAPEDYPVSALAAVGTHDLPTFRGWWRGTDIDLRETLGQFDLERAEHERRVRHLDRARLMEALHTRGLATGPEPPEDPPIAATTRYLARSATALAALQLEDAAGELNQANLPGVHAGYPNWRRRLGVELDELFAAGGSLAKLAAAMAAEGRGARPGLTPLAAPPPRATYRLQFHECFTFDDAARLVPYLARLGVSHVYASPIHQARPGSTHGYDIVDHRRVAAALGGEAGLRRLGEALRAHGLGLLLDIVPNHMGVGGADNAAWLDVLEWGEASPCARWFDIDWQRPGAGGRLMAPFLDATYGDALDQGSLRLVFDAAGFAVQHHEHRFPLSPFTWPAILERALGALGGGDATAQQATLAATSERLLTLAGETDRTAEERRTEGIALKEAVAAVAAESAVAEAIASAVAAFNGIPGRPDSFDPLHRILEAQHYRLAHWRVASSDINYRRFFDIDGLAGLRIEDPEVFRAAHETVFGLVRDGLVQGLRIDHVDGLADPAGYLAALQEELGPGFYLVVEKILEPGERLREWPVAGTTGYETLNLIDGLFVDSGAGGMFERIYRRATGIEGSYGRLLQDAKSTILQTSFASELEGLTGVLREIADADRHTRDFSAVALRRALIEIIARFPVYRSYLDGRAAATADRALIAGTVARAKRATGLPDGSAHDFIARLLIPSGGDRGVDPARLARFRTRFQQLTGPVTAKSLEDTLFYRYVRLIALNEVGGDPGGFGVPPGRFHAAAAERAEAWPHALIATATHDTKRGEDARARLLALSEMPADWLRAWTRWRRVAAPHLTEIGGEAAPDANDQYMLFQAILGAWPFDLMDETADPAAIERFRERMAEYAAKALRESKRHTSWMNVDDDYEAAANRLLAGLLAPDAPFLATFRPLVRRLARLGAATGLARTVLKCTLPGVPDIYQGTEFWDFSLVDPDNRRPVDFAARDAALEQNGDPASLLEHWRDGRVKQAVLTRLLRLRSERPRLFAEGDYTPLPVAGGQAEHVVAFARGTPRERLAVVVPRLVARLVGPDELAPPAAAFAGTTVTLPPGRWRNILADSASAESTQIAGGSADCAELFAGFPVVVLMETE